MTAGPFTRHRSDPLVIEELAGQITSYGTQAVTVATAADRSATTAATVDSFGLYAPIRSAIRPTVTGADSLAAASRVGGLALRVWSHAVRTYNRTIDDLNAEWATAQAAGFGVGPLDVDRSALNPDAVEKAVSDHAGQVAQARSALAASLRARQRAAEDTLDRVAVRSGALLDHADDADIQTLTSYTAGPATVTTISNDDSGEYPDSVMHGDPDAYWSTPEARAAQMREDELDNYDGADLDWNDLGETLAFLFADPRECVGDDASIGGCAFETATLLPLAKWLKAAKLAKAAKKTDNTDTADGADDAADGARDAERGADDAAEGLTHPPVHEGKQGKHIPGHPNYQEGKSILKADPDELAKRAGTGTPVNNVPRGEPGFKERVDYGKTIGTYIDPDTKERIETSRAIIVHARNDIHIYPVRPR